MVNLYYPRLQDFLIYKKIPYSGLIDLFFVKNKNK